MTSDELKGTVSTILGQQHSAQLYLILKVNDELIVRNLSIADESPNAVYEYDCMSKTTR